LVGFGEFVREAAPSIFITGAGGVFGKMFAKFRELRIPFTSEFSGMHWVVPAFLCGCRLKDPLRNHPQCIGNQPPFIIAPLMPAFKGLSEPFYGLP